ncbi:orotidine-5'-phosphate decarboxylase [Virgisporangium ochraceum]|uniref:Orotidine 5'-phosphate decarboxylase n=1 Tax=Virgisporangium ochraceum TaxID=65505 RepID=A0A8J3ZQX6_9ACTN|nr:orotidine-5'-phosphate decarboxylase [Virgisporangium ochraceum]GIJ66675.1 orotidine 5'-phosphate decarboxylase [Virgisporangium ochraceum]
MSAVIVALDFDNAADAVAVVDRLGDAAPSYKVGLELLTSAGPAVVNTLVGKGKEVFLDLKLFEIPASVAAAVRAAGRLGVSMVTVHATGGPAVLDAAVGAAADVPGLRVLALTVVTSLGDADLAAVGVDATVGEQTLRLARLAHRAGCHGVVAAARSAPSLRAVLGPDPLVVTPGVATPAEAVAAVGAGASHVVIGRAVAKAGDPLAALTAVRNALAVR